MTPFPLAGRHPELEESGSPDIRLQGSGTLAGCDPEGLGNHPSVRNDGEVGKGSSCRDIVVQCNHAGQVAVVAAKVIEEPEQEEITPPLWLLKAGNIKECSEFLVLLTRNSIDRPWVLIEISAALGS